MLLPVAAAAAALPVAVADALARIELASFGEMVVTDELDETAAEAVADAELDPEDALEDDESEEPDEPEELEEEPEELEEPRPLREAEERESGTVSMNTRAGPATTLVKTIWTSGETGCWSLTMNRATGPLMPSGTTH